MYRPQCYPSSTSWRPNYVPNAWSPHGIRGSYRKPQFQTQPRSENYWCETCDRGFPNVGMLDKHKQEHQKCNIDGCQFVAHPKIVTMHIQMQHSSGLFKKIAKLKNPEEIEKWREERKKKYPTKLNVEKKAAEIKEKIERGEKMGLKQEKHYQRSDNQGANRKRNYQLKTDTKTKSVKQNRLNNSFAPKKKMPPREEKALPLMEDKRNLRPFLGISHLIMESDVEEMIEEQCEDIIEYEDPQLPCAEPKDNSKCSEPTICGALSSLICNYESSDDEDNTTDRNIVTTGSQYSSKIDMKKSKSIIEVANFNGKHLKLKNVSDSNVHKTKLSDDDDPEKIKVIKENTISYSCDHNVKENNDTDDEGPEEVKILKDKPEIAENIEMEPKKFVGKKKVTKVNEVKQRTIPNRKRKIPSTLLQKLLQNEIRQERNIVLQCIRHVIKNNFFDE